MIIKNKLKNINDVKLLIFDIDQTLTDYNTIEAMIKKAFEICKIVYKEEYFKITLKSMDDAIKIAESKQYLTDELLGKCYEDNLIILKESGIDGKYFGNLLKALEKEFIITFEKMEETIKRLSEKYRIVCLSNWFENIASEKLEKVNLRKYISKIYTCENNFAKPNPIAFSRVLKEEKLSSNQVIMIGDKKADVLCYNYGIKTILMDYKNNKSSNVKKLSNAVVTESEDLCNILI